MSCLHLKDYLLFILEFEKIMSGGTIPVLKNLLRCYNKGTDY